MAICKHHWLTMHISDVLNDLKIAINSLINQNVAFPMSESSDSYADCKSSCGLIQKMCLVEPSWFHLKDDPHLIHLGPLLLVLARCLLQPDLGHDAHQ